MRSHDKTEILLLELFRHRIYNIVVLKGNWLRSWNRFDSLGIIVKYSIQNYRWFFFVLRLLSCWLFVWLFVWLLSLFRLRARSLFRLFELLSGWLFGWLFKLWFRWVWILLFFFVDFGLRRFVSVDNTLAVRGFRKYLCR